MHLLSRLWPSHKNVKRCGVSKGLFVKKSFMPSVSSLATVYKPRSNSLCTWASSCSSLGRCEFVMFVADQ